MPTKYDDAGYHDGAAEEAGQPPENGFAHIGIYLAWIIRHDLIDPRWFLPEHVQSVRNGDMTGSDLADDIDGKLVSDLMTPEGAAFSDASYDTYMSEWTSLFANEPDYGVADDADTYARVEPMLDRLFADWIAAGRPRPEPKEESELDDAFDSVFDRADIPWEELAADADGPIGVQINADGTYEVHRPELPHADPDLEARVPVDLVDAPIEFMSTTATGYGSSLLNRALKGLGKRPRDVTIATGLAGSGDRTFGITLYRVPGTSAESLMAAFGDVIHRPRSSMWEARKFGDTDVQWASGYDGPDRDFYFEVAYWTRHELVLMVHGKPEDMEKAIRRLG